MDRAVGTAVHSTDPPRSNGSARRNIARAATRGRRGRGRHVGCIAASGPLISGTKWIVAGLILVTPPLSISAQNRWSRQVHDQLQRALTVAHAQVAESALLHVAESALLHKEGTLNQEESASFTVTLREGVSYSILGVCDEDCARLRLVLATLANSELALDRTSENFPVLQFTPSVTAQYRIRVGMEECRVNPCWYGAGVIRSRGAKP